MKQTATNPKSKQLFIKNNIVARFNNSTVKNLKQDNLVTNDTSPTTQTSIIKTA